jgi:hypothetical protein
MIPIGAKRVDDQISLERNENNCDVVLIRHGVMAANHLRQRACRGTSKNPRRHPIVINNRNGISATADETRLRPGVVWSVRREICRKTWQNRPETARIKENQKKDVAFILILSEA